jgi:hypothetical protein
MCVSCKDKEFCHGCRKKKKMSHFTCKLCGAVDFEVMRCKKQNICIACQEEKQKEGAQEEARKEEVVDDYYCQECGVSLGSCNPRQLCGKTQCLKGK